MKKIWLVPLLSIAFFCVGCGSNNTESVMSEQTEVYFYGEDNGISINIAVGKRENPYIMDGVHYDVCDFSLITLCNENGEVSDEIAVQLEVNGQIKDVALQLNPLNLSYMTDLGYALKADDEIAVVYNGDTINLCNLSDSFAVDYRQATKIGYDAIDDKSVYVEDGKLACEGYLKILDGKLFGGEGLHWCFTLVNRNGDSCNILISVYDENVVFSG
ncbi:MAG: hypothetical protein J6A28_02555 [Clostridia bacterium]|nr:hypothetical protein [Clostridia bacterium]